LRPPQKDLLQKDARAKRSSIFFNAVLKGNTRGYHRR